MTSFDHQVLNEKLECKDNKEGWIVEERGEHVNLVGIHNSAVDLVEQVHQDETVEADSIEHKSVSWLTIIISQSLGDWVEALLKEKVWTSVH